MSKTIVTKDELKEIAEETIKSIAEYRKSGNWQALLNDAYEYTVEKNITFNYISGFSVLIKSAYSDGYGVEWILHSGFSFIITSKGRKKLITQYTDFETAYDFLNYLAKTVKL